MHTEDLQEKWHVDSGGVEYETTFAELTNWIEEGSVLRIDRVRKGNLRWIEAGKVPSLIAVFNAKELGRPSPPVVTTTRLEPADLGVQANGPTALPQTAHQSAALDDPLGPVCTIHDEISAEFLCNTCSNYFCGQCPNRYSSVRICPMCGAMCQTIQKAMSTVADVERRASIGGGTLGIDDVFRAITHPFKFKVSLILGAVIYAVLSLGTSAVGFGGIFMLGSAIFCFMLANMLTFGVLAHTTEGFASGKLDNDFMPSFEDFSVWDDVIQPFFLSLAAYIVSFGPFLALLIVTVFFVMSSIGGQMNAARSDAAASVDPSLPYASNAVARTSEIREMIQKQKALQDQRIRAMDDRSIQPDVTSTEPSDMEFQAMNDRIQEQRKAQLESAVGKTPETVAKEREALFRQLLGYGAIFLFLAVLTLLWGIFYFPAACTVAGYTRSIGATLNPTVGFDTIRRLGFDYAKLLGVSLLLSIASGIVTLVLAVVLNAFELPGLGNLPAKFIGSIVGFYFWTVFSCVIGYMLFKAADRLKLPS